ncbi:MAG: hemerythrin domain-containing protein [Candidatus Aramenus sp.]|jgi:hemerythrin superfamily protein|nr:hemerythrin domain-containing protein [Candidatus Aramenus sp.]
MRTSIQGLKDDHSFVEKSLNELTVYDVEKMRGTLARLFEVTKFHMYVEEEYVFPKIEEKPLSRTLLYQHVVIWNLFNDLLKEEYPNFDHLRLLLAMVSLHAFLEEERVYPYFKDTTLEVDELPKGWEPRFARPYDSMFDK